MSESKLGFYTERSGVGVEQDVAMLLCAPEIRLCEAELTDAYQFAQDLFDGSPPKLLRDSLGNAADGLRCPKNLTEIRNNSIAVHAHTFYTGYFETSAGEGKLHSVGLVADTEDNVSMRYERTLAAASNDWFIDELSSRLASNRAEDVSCTDATKRFEHTAPHKLLDQLDDLQGYRTLYRHVSAALAEQVKKEGLTDILVVKKYLLALHYERVNDMVADSYPVATKTAVWLEGQPPSEENIKLRDRFASAAPAAAYLFNLVPEKQALVCDQLTRRLDLLRNGAARQADGSLGPISAELTGLIEGLSDRGDAADLTPVVTAEVLKTMENTTWEADDLDEFLSALLAEWGLLSAHKSNWQEVGDRSGPASDGKWQIIITPKAQSLSVNSAKQIMSVPKKFKRTLSQDSPAGALPISAHEVVHVLQAEYARRQIGRLALAQIGGRRAGVMKEMGGVHQEREFFHLIGKTRTVNSTYYRALQAKTNGANQTETARAFLDAGDPATAMGRRAPAADRSLRLYRNGGHNSQPLNYAEQDLIVQSLRHLPGEQVTAIAIAGSCFSLRDTAKLHRCGLLDIPQAVPYQPAKDVLNVYLRDFYRAA